MATTPISVGSPRRVFYGALVHSVSLVELEYAQNALLGVTAAGVIAFIERAVAEEDIAKKLQERGWQGAELFALAKEEFLVPGLIDTHTHAPQFPNLGFGQQYELLDWLTNVTFPTEAKFSDPAYARRTYESVVQRVINAGTTTVCYYGTIHLTTKILAAVCHRKGQRAFVGKCNMDRESAPNYTEKSAAHSIADTKEFVAYVRTHCVSPNPIASPDGNLALTFASPPLSPLELPSSPTLSASSTPSSFRSRTSSLSNGNAGRIAKNISSKTSLVQPILTPRFAISCSDALLAGLGAMLAKDPTLPIQTHLAENPSEIEFAKSLFPSAESYTAIYDQFDLLRGNTILAHCVHLEESELQLIKKRNSGISHCPTSNFNLRSGTTRVGDMLDRGIKVSLGTDISGGFGLGILTALRQASIASKVLIVQARESGSLPIPPPALTTAPASATGKPVYPVGYFSSRHLNLEALFYLATLGGAEVCNLEDRVGNFVVGKEFDALWVRTGQKDVVVEQEEEYDEEVYRDMPDRLAEGLNPGLFVEEEDSLEKLFEKFLFAGDDRNIASVFVRGRCIGGARPLQ